MKDQQTTHNAPEPFWSIGDQLKAQEKTRGELRLTAAVCLLAGEHGAPPHQADALAAQARAAFPVIDGQPRLPKGMTLEDWVAARLQAISAAAPDPSIALAAPNPFARATWNLTRQMRLQNLNPALAARLKAAASHNG